MLVAPVCLRLGKVFPLLRLRWWVCDLCDQEGSRGFSNAVDKNTEERNLKEDEEANAKAEEDALAIVEPDLLLLRGESNTREVRLELYYLLDL
jgi:hypothetical protein